MSKVLVFCVKTYQAAVSPILPFNHCRFYPTCSQYAVEAIQKHGAWRGGRLAILRVLKCHPFHTHRGFDPVP